MTSEAIPKPNAAPRPKVLRLRAAGWSAKVVVDAVETKSDLSGNSSFPSESDWTKWIARLLAESSDSKQRQYLKYSPSVEIFRDQIPIGETAGGIEIICKRKKAEGFLDRIRMSRAERNFRCGWMLLQAGIQTATPLAIVDCHKPMRESFLVTRYLPDLMDLDRIAMLELPRMSRPKAVKLKRVLCDQVSAHFARFHAGRLHHRDMKASNIMVLNANTPESASLCILDLDGLGAASKWRSGQRWQPLMRLAASLIEYRSITRADHARCLRRYLMLTDGKSRDWREMYRRLSVQARNYAVASGARKSGKLDAS